MIVDGRIEGKIVHIGQEEQVGKNNLRKRSFVVEEAGDKEYKSSLAIDLLKDRVEMLDGYNVGDVVKVSVNFRANEYNGKYFNSISAWRIEKSDGTSAAPEADDDLPF